MLYLLEIFGQKLDFQLQIYMLLEYMMMRKPIGPAVSVSTLI